MQKKFKIFTLGCKTNQYESQLISEALEQNGYSKSESEGVDLCIINSCAVTKSAEKRSKEAIKRIRAKNPNAKIVLTGCLAEKVGSGGEELVLKREEIVSKLIGKWCNVSGISRFDNHVRAFVKIQDGCNSFCSYCIVPHLRGRSRSRDRGSILEEVKRLCKNGYKEIVLTGIDIGDFEGGVASLIKELEDIEGLERIRLSSIDIQYIDQSFVELLKQSKKFCKSLHIPLQSGSNEILKLMRRSYSVEEYFQKIVNLKMISEELTFSTDVIIGFPSESEEDFFKTLQVIKEVRFAKVHIFPYSRREGTLASNFKDEVDQKVISQRCEEAFRISDAISFQIRENMIGKEVELLIENKKKERRLLAHTDNFLPAFISACEIKSGDIVKAKVVENCIEGLKCSLK